MKLSHIRDVIAVAERGSLRSAARHLRVAQPTITRSIRELEHELGVALFERHATGVVPTPMGRVFLRRASAAQLELDRSKDEIQQLTGLKTGSLVIGLSSAAHLALLSKVLPTFQEKYRDVRLRIIEGLFPIMESELLDGSIDFYIGPLGGNELSSEFTVEKLFDNRRIIVGRRGHPLASARSLSELVEARWVLTSITLTSEGELDPIFGRFGLPYPSVSIKVQTALSIVMVAAYSDCLAMLPQQWMEFIRSSQLLHHFKVREELAAPAICIVRRTRLPLAPVAEHLCDLFRRAASQHAKKTPARLSDL
jgi:LysR family transcriptional regulator, regulator of abg operon